MRSSAAERKNQAGEEGGFTLVELLMVIVVIGVLTTIAVIGFGGFSDRGSRTAARSNVRTAIPALTAFHYEHDTYVGATLAVLRNQYDLAIDDSSTSEYEVSGQSVGSFCFQNRVGDWYAWTTGLNEPIDAGTSSHC